MAGRNETHGASYDRVTVAEAARRLGISEPAVRARIQRGTLQSERVDGTVYVRITAYSTPHDTPSTTLAAKDAHIADLRAQLEAERQAHEQTRRLLGGALERIPALAAPETSDTGAQDAATVQEGYDSPTTRAGDPEPAQRPWWRRVFGP